MTSSDTKVLWGAIGLLTLLVAFALGADGDRQPVRYNHKMHLEDVGLECLDCHQNVETRARAMIPNIGVCGDCHDDVEVDNPEERKVADYYSRGEQIPWRQVHVVPDHAYFSHRRHVVLGQIECATCHGDVTQREEPFLVPYRVIQMEWCLECHEESAVPSDCDACHR